MLIAVVTILLAGATLLRYGFLHLGALLVALVAFRYVGFPFFAKLVFGQPLDSNLEQPAGSFLVVLIGVAAYVVALWLADKVHVGRPLLRPVTDIGRLRFIALAVGVVGIAANASVALSSPQNVTGVTVATFFLPLLNLAIIAAVAAAGRQSGGRRGSDALVATLVAVALVFALARNVRSPILDVLLSYTLAMISFRGVITKKQVMGFGLVLVTIIIFVTPVMLAVRVDRGDLSWSERVEATVMTSLDWRGALETYREQQASRKRFSYLLYYGQPENALERMSFVNHVDVLKAATDNAGSIGLREVVVALERVPPRVLVPDKPVGYGHGDWVYRELGVSTAQSGYATAPLIGNGYAAYGWIGAFAYPLVLSFLLLLALKAVSSWSLYGNIWVIYLLVRMHNVFVEGGTEGFLVALLRSLPQDLVLLLVVAALSSSLRRPRTKVVEQPRPAHSTGPDRLANVDADA